LISHLVFVRRCAVKPGFAFDVSEPMLCESAEQPPNGPEWRYELKLDGYRTIGFKTDAPAHLWSRDGNFVRRFPETPKAIASLPEDTAVDGALHSTPTASRHSFCFKVPERRQSCFTSSMC
jgi:bifunctional non-homologous end joining protein LigD